MSSSHNNGKNNNKENKARPQTYPAVRRSDHVDTIHTKHITDPYRWLEDPDAKETKLFVQAQNECTASIFSTIPHRRVMRDRMTELYNYEKYGNMSKHAGRYFYYKNDGLQNQFVLYTQQTLDEDAKSTVVLDPNNLSDDGTAALGATSFSEGNNIDSTLHFAYGVSRGGSDWQTISVLRLEADGTTTKLDDEVQWVKFTQISWTHDDKGFFYCRFPAPPELKGDSESSLGTETDLNVNHQVWYHSLGTNQSEDVLCFAYSTKPKYYVGAEVSIDGKYLICSVQEGCKNANMVHVAELGHSFDVFVSNPDRKEGTILPVTKLVDDMDDAYEYILNKGSVFYFQTNAGAPRERIVKTDLANHNDTVTWVEVIPEHKGTGVLKSSMLVNHDTLIVKYMNDVKHDVKMFDLEGTETGELKLPGVGSVRLSGNHDDNELFYVFTSFLYPGSAFRADLNTPSEAPTLVRETKVAGFDASLYETKQVFYNSKDGTRIPMFLVYRKGLKLDGTHPTYLYGYGGFNISLAPSFSVFRLVFLQHLQGVLAYANLRGGGEYGEEWHQMGTFGNKQNVFDDFIAAGEYLVSNKYTNPSRLAIHGGSNGGLLVAACANQRPALFRCAVAAVGVLDMLRFHKFTCGHGWCSDFGDPDEPGAFQYIRAYSPLHNVPDAKDIESYPCTLLTTGDHDDRVVPLHSFKFISELQHKLGASCTATENPLLIRIETKAGHGAGKPTSKVIEEYADVYAFMAWALKQDYV